MSWADHLNCFSKYLLAPVQYFKFKSKGLIQNQEKTIHYSKHFKGLMFSHSNILRYSKQWNVMYFHIFHKVCLCRLCDIVPSFSFEKSGWEGPYVKVCFSSYYGPTVMLIKMLSVLSDKLDTSQTNSSPLCLPSDYLLLTVKGTSSIVCSCDIRYGILKASFLCL